MTVRVGMLFSFEIECGYGEQILSEQVNLTLLG